MQLSDVEVDTLWDLFSAIHDTWGGDECRVVDMASRWREFIEVKVDESPTQILRKSTEPGTLAPKSLRTEKSVHASPANQLNPIANADYTDNVCVAVVRKAKVQTPIKLESAAARIYPHIYGPLNKSFHSVLERRVSSTSVY